MAELTKEKILQMASDYINDGASPFEALNDIEWLKAQLFYNTGINDFARAIAKEMEKSND